MNVSNFEHFFQPISAPWPKNIAFTAVFGISNSYWFGDIFFWLSFLEINPIKLLLHKISLARILTETSLWKQIFNAMICSKWNCYFLRLARKLFKNVVLILRKHCPFEISLLLVILFSYYLFGHNFNFNFSIQLINWMEKLSILKAAK